MATRSIHLKVVVPRGGDKDATGTREAFQRTHLAFNEAVTFYERLLLEMRQRDVCTGDGDDEVVIPGDEWRADLGKRLRLRGVQPTDEILDDFHTLYRVMIRSFDAPAPKKNGKKTKDAGTANDAIAWLGALLDPKSEAGQKRFEVLDEKQLGWVLDRSPTDPKLVTEIERKIASDDSLLHPVGKLPTWILRYNAEKKSPTGNPAVWLEPLLAMLKEKKEQRDGDHAAAVRLETAGALPLIDAQIPVGGRTDAMNSWDRAALAQAASHVLAWESWRHRMADERRKLQERIAAWKKKRKGLDAAILKLRDYEQQRTASLVATGLWTPDSKYQIGPRELRKGWAKLREWLEKHPAATQEERKKFLKSLQGRLKGRFGGADLLGWLAEPGQQDLVGHKMDPVSWLSADNALRRKLERSRLLPRFTFTDAVLHPAGVLLDSVGNSNKPSYCLHQNQAGGLDVDLPLLHVPAAGVYEERTQRFELAKSYQLTGLQLVDVRATKKNGEDGRIERQRLSFVSQDRMRRVEVAAKGASLMLQREDVLRGGDLGRVYFKLAVDHTIDLDVLRPRLSSRAFLGKAIGNRLKVPPEEREKLVRDGLRVMGVHLAMRTAAACAVFEVIDPRKRGDVECWGEVEGMPIVHDRSFTMELPGDKPRRQEMILRAEASKSLGDVKASIGRLKAVRALADESEPEKRKERIDKLGEMLPPELAKMIPTKLGRNPRNWRSDVMPLYHELEQRVGEEVKDLRLEQRKARHPGPGASKPYDRRLGGKSMWRIAYLERTRRMLVSWECHSMPGRPIVRLDRSSRGTLAKKLLKHLNALKEDRAKSTADLVVQAAAGRRYGKAKWEAPGPGSWRTTRKSAGGELRGVDIVVFGDLSGYRFRLKREPAENVRLMQWCHRAVRGWADMQAELEAVATTDTTIAHGMLFDARTGAPGLRCRIMTKPDTVGLHVSREGYWLYDHLEQAGLSHKEIMQLEDGSLVPVEDGQEFVTLRKAADGFALARVHASINGARNAALRFLEGHKDQVRVVAFAVDGSNGERLAKSSLGVRAQGAFGGKALSFDAVDPLNTTFRATPHKTARALAKALEIDLGALAEDEEAEIVGDDEEDSEELLKAIKEASKGRRELFRDPSGVFFDSKLWVIEDVFWSRVTEMVVDELRRRSWCR